MGVPRTACVHNVHRYVGCCDLGWNRNLRHDVLDLSKALNEASGSVRGGTNVGHEALLDEGRYDGALPDTLCGRPMSKILGG